LDANKLNSSQQNAMINKKPSQNPSKKPRPPSQQAHFPQTSNLQAQQNLLNPLQALFNQFPQFTSSPNPTNILMPQFGASTAPSQQHSSEIDSKMLNKKRKLIESEALFNSPILSSHSKPKQIKKDDSGSVNSLNNSGMDGGSTAGSDPNEINYNQYESTDEYKWHQMRIKQEEDMLKEQLTAYNLLRIQKNKQQQQQKISPSSLNPSQSTSSSSNKSQAQHTTNFVSSMKNSQSIKKPEPTITQVFGSGSGINRPVTPSNLSLTSNQMQKKQQKTISPPQTSILNQQIMMHNNNNLKQFVPHPKPSTSSHSSSNKPSKNAMQILGTAVTEIVSHQWSCPACKTNDESESMICCDSCDDWYHW
jgi:hypothetical protein